MKKYLFLAAMMLTGLIGSAAAISGSLCMSVLENKGVDELLAACVEMLSHRVERQTYRIPLAESRIIAIMHRDGKVLNTEYEGNDAIENMLNFFRETF